MDLEPLLAPLSGADACGENLEYDAGFAELERSAQGKAEQQMGDTIVAAVEPEWKLVDKQALALLGRSKDLRVACQWAKARLRTAGLPGFAEALVLLRGLIERYWEGVHPRLDPDDGNDPTMRVNIIMGLVASDLLTAVRNTPLVSSRSMGRFGMREVEMASGEAPPVEGTPPPSMATIDGAMMDVEVTALAEMANAASMGGEAVAAIEASVTDQVGTSNAPNLAPLGKLFRKIEAFLAGGLARRQPGADTGDGAGTNGASSDADGAPRARGGGALSGDISSREDVVRALDKIIAYYGRSEPSSPIPMFMERCKRLVTMNFLDIVRDLAPDAVSQVETLKGRTE
jgi:type VI secretion system protein ImpA